MARNKEEKLTGEAKMVAQLAMVALVQELREPRFCLFGKPFQCSCGKELVFLRNNQTSTCKCRKKWHLAGAIEEVPIRHKDKKV